MNHYNWGKLSAGKRCGKLELSQGELLKEASDRMEPVICFWRMIIRLMSWVNKEYALKKQSIYRIDWDILRSGLG